MDAIVIAYRANRFAGYVMALCSLPFALIFLMAVIADPGAVITWIGLAIFGGLCVYGALLIRASGDQTRHVELTDTVITLPKSPVRNGSATIAYSTIKRLHWYPKYLGIRHDAGLIWITKASLPDSASFDLLYETLQTRTT